MASSSDLPIGWAEGRDLPNAAFVDSQGWMALVSSEEGDHVVASSKFNELVNDGWLLFTSTWTVHDAVSHIRERKKNGGYDVARGLWDRARDPTLIQLLSVPPEIEELAVNVFWSVKDKSWSVTTCANLVLMNRNGVTRVLSANRHYQQAGLINLY